MSQYRRYTDCLKVFETRVVRIAPLVVEDTKSKHCYYIMATN